MVVPKTFQDRDTDRNHAPPILLLGLWALLPLALFGRKRVLIDTEGASILRVPIRVAAAYHAKVRGMGRRRLRRLLRSVPVYATLLNENPLSRVAVADGPQ